MNQPVFDRSTRPDADKSFSQLKTLAELAERLWNIEELGLAEL